MAESMPAESMPAESMTVPQSLPHLGRYHRRAGLGSRRLPGRWLQDRSGVVCLLRRLLRKVGGHGRRHRTNGGDRT